MKSRPCQPVFGLIRVIVLIALLTGCETEKMQQTDFVLQQNLFLQSLELIESAGTILQNPDLTQDNIQLAMSKLDQGLKQAFQVEQDFLQKLDVRLPKLYAEAFIVGVENYRIGVEASDREKQLHGLGLLSQWGKFWLQEKNNIKQKMANLNS